MLWVYDLRENKFVYLLIIIIQNYESVVVYIKLHDSYSHRHLFKCNKNNLNISKSTFNLMCC